MPSFRGSAHRRHIRGGCVLLFQSLNIINGLIDCIGCLMRVPVNFRRGACRGAMPHASLGLHTTCLLQRLHHLLQQILPRNVERLGQALYMIGKVLTSPSIQNLSSCGSQTPSSSRSQRRSLPKDRLRRPHFKERLRFWITTRIGCQDKALLF